MNLRYGLNLAKAAVTQRRDALRLHTTPPPRRLQERVVGGYAADFLASGERLVGTLDEILLTSTGRTLKNFYRILDFGCGCGRLIPALHYRTNASIHGADIDKEAVKWCKEHLKGKFRAVPERPPTGYPDGNFDLIYSVSVFTHLPLDMHFEWLAELKRIAGHDGILVLTIKSEAPTVEENAELARTGFAFTGVPPTDGLPGFYRAAYQTHGFIMREWSRYFEVLSIIPSAMDGQDAVVLRA